MGGAVIIELTRCDLCGTRNFCVVEGLAQCARCNPGLMGFAKQENERLAYERRIAEQDDYLPPE
jgi:hypothetical protein